MSTEAGYCVGSSSFADYSSGCSWSTRAVLSSRAPDPVISRGTASKASTANHDGSVKRGRLMDELRGYIREHRNVLFTVVLVLLLDHLFFEGAMRERLKQLLSGMLTKAEGSLGLPAKS